MIEFKLPELGEKIAKGDLVRLMVAPGVAVSAGQAVMELETDKAVVEVPSSVSGTVQEIRVKEGDQIKVGQVIFTVDGAEAKASNAAKLSLSLRALPGATGEKFDEKKFSDLVEAIADFSSEQGVSVDTENLEQGMSGASGEYENALKVFEDQEIHARDRAVSRHEKKQQGFRAEPDLVRGLQAAGTVVARGDRVGLTLLRAPANYDFAKLTRHLIARAARSEKANQAGTTDQARVTRGGVVHVPKPPKTIYNPDRPVSSLLKAQVEHFREAASKLPLRYRHEIDTYVNAIKTEGEAARYIRAVTEAIHLAHQDAERERRAPKRKRVIEIAAVADERAERSAARRKEKLAARAAVRQKKTRRKDMRKG